MLSHLISIAKRLRREFVVRSQSKQQSGQQIELGLINSNLEKMASALIEIKRDLEILRDEEGGRGQAAHERGETHSVDIRSLWTEVHALKATIEALIAPDRERAIEEIVSEVRTEISSTLAMFVREIDQEFKKPDHLSLEANSSS